MMSIADAGTMILPLLDEFSGHMSCLERDLRLQTCAEQLRYVREAQTLIC